LEENRKPQNQSRPAFYAVIPADVRYDDRLPQGAKLLYGEITALCNMKGFCWSRNPYFANLYQKDERTINRWLKALKDGGHISISYTFIPGSKEVDERIIRISNPAARPEKDGKGSAAAPPEDGGENAAAAGQDRPDPAVSSGGGDMGVTTPGQFCPGVVTILSPRMDKNVQDNSTSTNITLANITKTAAADTDAAPEKTPEKARAASPPEAAAARNIQKLKDAIAAVSRDLIFDSSFYPKALAFMAANHLDDRYLSWLHAQCLAKKPRFLPGLFYSLFFAGNMTGLFKVSCPPPRAPPPQVIVPCPVCGASRDKNRDCPACGTGPSVPKERIGFLRRVYALPDEQRKGFLSREEAILTENGIFSDFKRKSALLRALREEFGLAGEEEDSS
jgi:hypothetical protein